MIDLYPPHLLKQGVIFYANQYDNSSLWYLVISAYLEKGVLNYEGVDNQFKWYECDQVKICYLGVTTVEETPPEKNIGR